MGCILHCFRKRTSSLTTGLTTISSAIAPLRSSFSSSFMKTFQDGYRAEKGTDPSQKNNWTYIVLMTPVDRRADSGLSHGRAQQHAITTLFESLRRCPWSWACTRMCPHTAWGGGRGSSHRWDVGFVLVCVWSLLMQQLLSLLVWNEQALPYGFCSWRMKESASEMWLRSPDLGSLAC